MAVISFRDVHGIAEELGVDVQTVRRWIQSGKLRAFKPGKEYRVRDADLEEFLAAREVRPKAVTSPSQRSLFNGLEEERRTAIGNLLGSWRGEHEEAIARWARARERGFSSVDAAAAFCAEVVAESAVGQHIIKEYLVPQTETLLSEDEAARERQELLDTHAHLQEAMSAAISLVEGMVDSESDVDAASKAIRKHLDTPLARSVDETRAERHDRPDLELYLKRERKRRREAGGQTMAEPAEGGRERPTA